MSSGRSKSNAVIILITVCTILAYGEAIDVWDGDSEAPAEMLKVNYKKQFDKINEYLEEKVDTDELEANMQATGKYYSQLSTDSLYSLTNRKLIEALKLFLSLGELDGTAMCNMVSYRILLQNDLSVDSVAHQAIHASDLESLTRVQRFIHNAGIRHAENCYSRYPVSFKGIYYRMEQAMIEKLSRLLDPYIRAQAEKELGTNSQRIYNRFVFQPEAMGVWNFAKHIYDSTPDLPVHSASFNRFRFQLNKQKGISMKKTKQLYRERVLEPCDYFVRQLRDIYIPARYDAVFHREEDDDEYYLSWARFRLCYSILELDHRQIIRQIDAIYKDNLAKEEEEDGTKLS